MTLNNSEKYRFEDFTINNYRKIIQHAKKNGYHFSFFYDQLLANSKQILWRHDVEFSPFIALKMAEIEITEGVRSTYFFQLHSEFYNVLEKDITEIVLKIKRMGHDIGLHFDSHYFGVTNEFELSHFLTLDSKYFNTIFDTDIKVFSFHNTTPFILSCDKDRYANLLNVYSGYFRDHYNYCSDSTGYWRFERLFDVLCDQSINKLHVLTHDAMWSDKVLAPRQRVLKSINDNAIRVTQWYDTTLLKFGAKNVDIDKVYE